MAQNIEIVKVFISELNYELIDNKNVDSILEKYKNDGARVVFSIVDAVNSKNKELLKITRRYLVKTKTFIISAQVNAVLKTELEVINILKKDKKINSDKKILLEISDQVFQTMSDKVAVFTGLLSAETGYPSFYVPNFNNKKIKGK